MRTNATPIKHGLTVSLHVNLTKLSHAAAQLQWATKALAFLSSLSGFQAPIHS